MPQVLVEFDLDGTHCLLVPADPTSADPTKDEPSEEEPACADTDEASARGNGLHSAARGAARPARTRPICGFELDGRRYLLYARTGPGRATQAGSEDPLASLTAREQQIVRLVCLGMVNKQIADRLRISEYTVKTYLKQIFCKLNVHSRSAMVYRCAAWSTVRPMGAL